MKLRLKDNSIRLRLTRPEVAQLATDGLIESETDFGTQKFRFSILARKDAAGLSAHLGQNGLSVIVPKNDLPAWAEGEEVGLYGGQATSTGPSLTIAVEKDFRCLDRSHAEDDEKDAYPHPALKAKFKS